MFNRRKVKTHMLANDTLRKFGFEPVGFFVSGKLVCDNGRQKSGNIAPLWKYVTGREGAETPNDIQ